MTNYHFLLFVCIMELQLLNADLMQTRKPAFFKDTEFLFLVCKEATVMTEYRVHMLKKVLLRQVCESSLELQFLSMTSTAFPLSYMSRKSQKFQAHCM